MNSRTGLAIAILGLGVLAAPGFAHGAPSNKDLEAQAATLDSRLSALESRTNQSLVEMQQQIEAARQELRTLRGQIEEAKHDLDATRQQQRDLYADLERRLLLVEHGAGSQTSGGNGAPTAPDVLFADETAAYGEAFAAMKAGRYEEAAQGFELYLAKYPKGPRADSATYWLGEAQYMQQDYAAALKSFQAVSAFPESRKLPDAQLKVGYCQYELKAFKNARRTLKNLISTYPDTEAAHQAQQRIAKMDEEGR